jgi:peptidoglycan hydrolase CwlO-like protein
MKRLKTVALLVFLMFCFLTIRFELYTNYSVNAQSQEEKLQQLEEQIKQYEQEIQKLSSQASTLSNQIAQFDAQIRLTSLRIAETEERIFLLGGRIDQLEGSLQALSTAFKSRAVRTYKMTKLNSPYLMLVAADDLPAAVSSYHYLQRIQESDRDLLLRLENAQVAYKEEKVDQEALQEQLEEQKTVLGAQKAAKAQLLEQTRNDEKRYQALLSAAKAEFEAIQAIIAGKGEEEEIGKVSQGEKIASIIQGPSCNSSGTHLHFIVREGSGNAANPFSYLRSGVDFENCSGSSCGSSDGDSFNPSGSWDWPVSPKIKFSQGYGSTWATRNTWVGRIYSFHNGIDINSESSSDVRAVRSGTLYRGSYTGQGCRLRYVRVDHEDSDIDTLYLHINY